MQRRVHRLRVRLFDRNLQRCQGDRTLAAGSAGPAYRSRESPQIHSHRGDGAVDVGRRARRSVRFDLDSPGVVAILGCALLHAFASLLEDLLLLRAGTGHLIRNIDLTAELTRISQTVDVAWIEAAVRGMDQVEQGMRRNLLRSLALESFAVGLASP